MKKLTFWALIGTGLWLAFIGGWIALGWDEFKCMAPNEWGDFLAGTISPLALFWLVVGYLRQGQELQQNSQEIKLQREALMLQQRELAAQVKATVVLAEHSERSANANSQVADLTKEEYERKLKIDTEMNTPNFDFSVADRDGERVCLMFNKGGAALDVRVRNAAGQIIQISQTNLKSGHSAFFPPNTIDLNDDEFSVSYTTLFSEGGVAFSVRVKNEEFFRESIGRTWS